MGASAGSSEILKEYLLRVGFKVDEKSTKTFDWSLGKLDLRVAALALGMRRVGMATMRMVQDFASGMEKLHYSSQKTGAAVGNIQALEAAGKRIGLTSGTMQTALEGMARNIRVNPGLLSIIKGFGVRVEGRDMADVARDTLKVVAGMPHMVGNMYGEMLFGLDSDSLLLLTKHADEFERVRQEFLQTQKALGINADEVSKASAEWKNQMREIKEIFDALQATTMVALLPVMKQVSGVVKEVLKDWVDIISKGRLGGSFGEFLGKMKDGIFGVKPGVQVNPAAAARAAGFVDANGRRAEIPTGASPAAPPAAAGKQLPLGLRQNNPGNLRSWGDTPTANGFANFASSQQGLSAMAGNLLAYSRRYGLNTVEEIIKRWAPSSENNTGAYIDSVSKALGVKSGDKLNLEDPKVLASLMGAITKHENGYNPFSATDLQGAAASRLGGVTIHQKTDIKVTAPDPHTAGRLVGTAADGANNNLVRNLSTVVK